MMKQELYAINSMRVPLSPLDGVYIISTVPRRKHPPTQVAVGQITTQPYFHQLTFILGRSAGEQNTQSSMIASDK